MIDDQTYLGTQDAGTNSTEFNSEVFRIQQEVEKISTATVVQVVRGPYDKNGNDIDPGSVVAVGYVDVKPMVHQVDGRNQPTPHDTVHKVSYKRTQGGRNAIIIDPEKDDIGQLVVNERDTSSVRATNEPSNPGSRRRYDKADGIYHGSPQQKEAPNQYVAFNKTGMIILDINGNKFTLSPDGVKIEARGNTIIMGDSGVLINGALISKNGDVITKHGTSLDNHVNTQVTPGDDNSGPPP